MLRLQLLLEADTVPDVVNIKNRTDIRLAVTTLQMFAHTHGGGYRQQLLVGHHGTISTIIFSFLSHFIDTRSVVGRRIEYCYTTRRKPPKKKKKKRTERY